MRKQSYYRSSTQDRSVHSPPGALGARAPRLSGGYAGDHTREQSALLPADETASFMAKQELLKIEAQQGGQLRRQLISALGKPIGQIMGLPGLNALYDQVCDHAPERDFSTRLLEVMSCDYTLKNDDFQRIPKTGPVVVVANHPFGAIEGVILISLMKKVRPDFKVMGNYYLSIIPDLHDVLIAVDNFETKDSAKQNIAPLKECMRCLRNGEMLVVFPAGEVSNLKIKDRKIKDSAWSPTIGKMIQKTQAPVLPIYFHGANGALFHMMGLIHPMLRTMMIPRELLTKKARTIQMAVGGVIAHKKLSAFSHSDELMSYLRMRTYLLRRRFIKDEPAKTAPRASSQAKNSPLNEERFEPIAPSAGADALEQEITKLPEEHLLLTSGAYQVFVAPKKMIPKTLQEIGRLRELTFRKVGEGTGNAIDLDDFDDYYEHLFIWHTTKRELVGAYRIGKTDEIINKYGVSGLYTSTLFTFKRSLFDQMGPALEMGRSFVRPEYQKSYSPLLLLWKGIGRFVMRNLDHKILFGPVSISADYSTASRELLVRYFKATKSFSEFSKLVKPKSPPKLKGLKRHEVREFRHVFQSVDKDNEDSSSVVTEMVTDVITDLETEFKGIPVLLKQYLKLGGQVLSFNVDHDFQDCLDGLIVVDLTEADPKVLANYMQRDNVRIFRKHHGKETP